MRSIRVFGIGSPFGDDQLGWKAIDMLLDDASLQPYLPDYLKLKKFDRPGLSLLSDFQDATAVILIDAIVSNNEIGRIHRLNKQEINSTKNLISTHHISIAETLQLGDNLNILPEKIILHGMEIDIHHNKDRLSDKINSSLNHFVNVIYQEIRELLESVAK